MKNICIQLKDNPLWAVAQAIKPEEAAKKTYQNYQFLISNTWYNLPTIRWRIDLIISLWNELKWALICQSLVLIKNIIINHYSNLNLLHCGYAATN